MYLAGAPMSDIAYELRIAAPTIRAWKKREHWDRQKTIAAENPQMDSEKIMALAKRDDLELEIPPELAERQTEYTDKMGEVAVKLAHHIAGMGADEILARSQKVKDIDAVARKALRLEENKPAVLIDLKILSQPVRPSKADNGQRSEERRVG